jgi:tetratricopeptide (TPR) repeat protein
MMAAGRGDLTAVTRKLRDVPADHPVRQLVELESAYLQGKPVAAAARALAAANGGYASAWGLVALAAQREGDLRAALAGARRAAELQPDGNWGRLVGELTAVCLKPLLGEADQRLRVGDAAGAAARAREAMALAPESGEARILAVRALLVLREVRGAVELVPGLPDTPDGLELKGRVAESLGQLDLALELYGRIPASDPRRCELIEGARTLWRLANAPPYVATARSAKGLTRRGLAAILLFEAPELAAKPGGSVGVFEDVVQLPERGEILTVARLGLVPGDPVTRAFHPGRKVTATELAGVLERLAAALGRPSPRWCNGAAAGCLALPETVTGEAAAGLAHSVAAGGGEPCPRH